MSTIGSPHITWTYAPLIVLGLVVLLLTRPAAQYEPAQRNAYVRIQMITIFGALVGAKVAVLFGDSLWPLEPFPGWANWLASGRSIVGALLFGFLTAELCKPLLHYPLPPNDRFAMALPFSLAIGRIGCWLSGCCLGIEWHGPLAMTAADGTQRFPAVPAELLFQLLVGGMFVYCYRQGVLKGRLFALYLVLYGSYRFGSEFMRATLKAFAGLSAYQWLSLLMIVAGLITLRLRRHQRPARMPEPPSPPRTVAA
ncbi:prolipoprotein diacylglyceryl transferase [Ahniella affigens]|nr:prolipoprotein diacylglyceryl transferase family protein [Ahniella affigens]